MEFGTIHDFRHLLGVLETCSPADKRGQLYFFSFFFFLSSFSFSSSLPSFFSSSLLSFSFFTEKGDGNGYWVGSQLWQHHSYIALLYLGCNCYWISLTSCLSWLPPILFPVTETLIVSLSPVKSPPVISHHAPLMSPLALCWEFSVHLPLNQSLYILVISSIPI